jgi:uncharacterized membrane protein (UPF0127 family)
VSTTATVTVLRAAEGAVVLDKVRVARGFASRLVGLLGRSELGPGEGLLLPRCGAVHTLGMRFPIDVVFVDDAGAIRAAFAAVPSGEVRVVRPGRVHALEAAAGTIGRHGLRPGDQLLLDGGAAWA